MDYGEVIKADKLVLRGLKFHGFHGVKPEEKKLGQKFLVDVDAWMDLQVAGKSDKLSDTISYTEIYRIVKDVVEGPPHNLLESVAQLIASTTLTKYPQISTVRVMVASSTEMLQQSEENLRFLLIEQGFPFGGNYLKRNRNKIEAQNSPRNRKKKSNTNPERCQEKSS
ncbi:dihydroneopterin aldolase 1-like isoform X1 [Actinidia eriantha]|uniref:dihydroneopterin aldolase 1-like isoform X1 n=1 Tax=Actinidia eriantha TaxID=165200 RepID=UPI002588750B|nr:dihydroneopterin aldolase 1-like isoform X1 [Actinidia eriantha]XP_057512974.1 dihydroneopterin aldolase 1-like isoform X1 [Actinidia eriantha]